MLIVDLILFLLSLLVLIRFAEYAIRYSSRIAKILRFPEFIVSFFIVALISILPEATISIISAFNGNPELGMGTLLGSNIADLTLIFGVVALFAKKEIKVESKILKNNFFYIALLSFPLILGFDGEFSRIDGLMLVVLGFLFFIRIYSESKKFPRKNNVKKGSLAKNLLLLLLSLILILLSAFLTVKYAVNFANDVKLPAVLIGFTILALGTCLPELTLSIEAVRKNHDELALGDILGTVIIDATIILGLVALISPFSYNPNNIYITGIGLFLAGIFVTYFMNSGKSINKLEGLMLITFYILFVLIGFFANKIFGLN